MPSHRELLSAILELGVCSVTLLCALGARAPVLCWYPHTALLLCFECLCEVEVMVWLEMERYGAAVGRLWWTVLREISPVSSKGLGADRKKG